MTAERRRHLIASVLATGAMPARPAPQRPCRHDAARASRSAPQADPRRRWLTQRTHR
ncbi:protein of unknown function [Rhodovastum atsumiense]|nr:protein of unknown function [Rhodovastum atsumiense]